MKKIIFSFALVIAFLGCKKDNSVSVQSFYFIEGRYQYQGFNLDSTLTTFGVVNVVLTDTTITGDRNIQASDASDSLDVEVGVGDISGYMYSDSTFFIYLASSNFQKILIRGQFSTGLIEGTRIFEEGAIWAPPVIGHYTLHKQ